MGRAEAGTPKAISNAIKAKGLQKLKFFCQTCQKQCRDANGFKCHIESEAHQRQLLLVAENPNGFVEQYSKDFLRDFMLLFRTRFGSRRVFANQVYQEYIKDRYHVHMNATKWYTLSAFVQWLGRNGYATVDQTEKGWFITYIDRDPETLRLQESLKQKDKIERDYDERMAKIIDEQIARGAANGHTSDGENSHDLEEHKLLRSSEDEKVRLNLQFRNKLPLDRCSTVTSSSSSSSLPPSTTIMTNGQVNGHANGFTNGKLQRLSPSDVSGTSISAATNFVEIKTDIDYVDEQHQDHHNHNGDNHHRVRKAKREHSPAQQKKKMSALEEIIEEEKQQKEKRLKKPKDENVWLTEGIVVKLLSEKLPERYYMKKGYIERVEDAFQAYVKVLDNGALIKSDQAHLETVIPREGNLVRIVRGSYRSEDAMLLHVDVSRRKARIRIETGSRKGKVLEDVELDDICKIHKP